MHTRLATLLIAGACASFGCLAAAPATAPAAAPAGSTGLCKDGSYVSVPDKKGACKGHKGVNDWYGATASAAGSASAPAMPATPAATATAAAPATPAAPVAKAATPAAMPTAQKAPAAAAPGGGAGKVWANDASKVYHCSGDKWYGKTKQGEYLSEADAKAKGFHAEHGKACAS